MVDELRAKWGDRVAALEAGTNADAADAELVVLATVWDAAVPRPPLTPTALAGKVVISMANGLEKGRREFRPGGPARRLHRRRGPGRPRAARVVAAFHLVPAAALADLDHHLTCDVLVVGDDDGARTIVLDLVDGIPGLRALRRRLARQRDRHRGVRRRAAHGEPAPQGRGGAAARGVGPRPAPTEPTAP